MTNIMNGVMVSLSIFNIYQNDNKYYMNSISYQNTMLSVVLRPNMTSVKKVEYTHDHAKA